MFTNTFQYEALQPDGSRAQGTIDASSAEDANRKLREEGMMPTTVIPATLAGQGAPAPAPQIPVKSASGYGWRIRARMLLVLYLPALLVTVVGCFLFFSARMPWLALPVMGSSFIFAFAGMRAKAMLLGSFQCPDCQNDFLEWQSNEKGRISYDCAQCGTRWDIGYKIGSDQ